MQLFAKPAKQGVMTVSTADGGELCVRLVGDEYFHQYFTEDGYPLVEREGNFYYCNFNADGQVIDSDIKAKDKSMRGPAARSFLADVDLSTLGARIAVRMVTTALLLIADMDFSRICVSRLMEIRKLL